MFQEEKRLTHRRIYFWLLTVEAIGFILAAVLLWVDELLDLPHLVFGTTATPVNFSESILESIIILVLGAAIMVLTSVLLRRIKYLEGFHIVCASCHQVYDKGEWVQLEAWVTTGSEVNFSHGLCPNCRASTEKELDSISHESFKG